MRVSTLIAGVATTAKAEAYSGPSSACRQFRVSGTILSKAMSMSANARRRNFLVQQRTFAAEVCWLWCRQLRVSMVLVA